MRQRKPLIRVPDDKAKKIFEELEKPFVPEGGDYELTTPHPAREKVTEILGIEESLVKPVSSPPAPKNKTVPAYIAWVRQFVRGTFPSTIGGWSGSGAGGESELKWKSQGQKEKRNLDELKSSRLEGGWWRPIRPTPKKDWPAEEIPTDWYESTYTSLYLRSRQFVEGYFGYGNIFLLGQDGRGKRGEDEDGDDEEDKEKDDRFGDWGKSLWLDLLTDSTTSTEVNAEKFRNYVSTVARQDNNAPGGWEDLLASRAHREYLVTGVLGKILTKYVWEDLLFGATPEQKDLLEKADKLTSAIDGFPRTASRADTVRSLLAGKLETDCFWQDVDKLTIKIMTLLLPLVNLMDANFYRSRERSLRAMYQELHYLVSQAAFLSLGMRWSHDIFRFEWPLPGLPYDKEQENLNDWVHNRSRERAKRFDLDEEQDAQSPKTHFWEYQDSLQLFFGLVYKLTVAARKKAVAFAMAGLDSTSTKARWDAMLKPMENQSRLRMAKVHIATWPALIRHEVVGEPAKHPLTGYLDTDGQRSTIIMKAPVVYYHGIEGAYGDYAERIPTLEEYVRGRRLERMWGTVRKVFVAQISIVIAWIALLAVAGWYFPSLYAFMRASDYLVRATFKAIVRKVSLWGLEVAGNLTRLIVGVFRVTTFVAYAVRNTLAERAGHDLPAGGPSWPASTGLDFGEDGVPPWVPIWWSSPTQDIDLPVAEEVEYPRLNTETFKILAKVIYHQARWKSAEDLVEQGNNLPQTAADWSEPEL